MITTFAPIEAVGSATASATLPPVRVAAAVGFVTAAGGAALGAVPPLAVAEAAGVVSVGAVGVASTGTAGVTAADATDAELVPAAFVAVTVNVYDLPFVSPLVRPSRIRQSNCYRPHNLNERQRGQLTPEVAEGRRPGCRA